ncbi:hypothetical protein B0H21DRAFT_886383 [Amylocystis lapponica]|nr:hypothetical protein B0H21DRAFT_886383 [Amylocystis lapponica]
MRTIREVAGQRLAKDYTPASQMSLGPPDDGHGETEDTEPDSGTDDVSNGSADGADSAVVTDEGDNGDNGEDGDNDGDGDNGEDGDNDGDGGNDDDNDDEVDVLEEDTQPEVDVHEKPAQDRREQPDLSIIEPATPLPCSEPDSSRIKTLFDLLRVSIPVAPRAYSDDALMSTKQVSKTEFKLPEEKRLQKVVFVPTLVTQLYGQASEKLQKIRIDWGNPIVERAVGRLHPFETKSALPNTIYSEKDAEDRAHAILFRPAMRAIHAVERQCLGDDQDLGYPFISSCPHRNVIPDGMIVRAEKDSKAYTVATIEVKAPTVMQNKAGEDKFLDLQGIDSKDPMGRAMKFNWPDKTPDNDDQTRLLMQVWTQLVEIKTRLGMLTTSESSVFLARGEGVDSDTLFISPIYEPTHCPLLATYSWFALAAGQLDMKGFQLPKANVTWWDKAVHQCEASGVVPASKPGYVEHLTSRQRTNRAADAVFCGFGGSKAKYKKHLTRREKDILGLEWLAPALPSAARHVPAITVRRRGYRSAVDATLSRILGMSAVFPGLSRTARMVALGTDSAQNNAHKLLDQAVTVARMVRSAIDLGLLPIACRFVSTDQWLVTHVSTSWSISQVKQCLLDHFLPPDVRPPSALRKPKRRALSPITFSLDRRTDYEPSTTDPEADVTALEDLDDTTGYRQFKYAPPPAPSESTPELSRLDAHSPNRYTLLAFSTGQILEDHFSLAWYTFHPHELLELHPRPHAVATLIILPRGTLGAYIRPYFEARVWALRLVDAGAGDVVQLDMPRRGKSRAKWREREYAEDEERRDRERRLKKMEWRERWVVIHQGVFKLCKDRNDVSPAHAAPLSALLALHGAEQLHPNCPSSPALHVPSSPVGTPLSSPILAPNPRPSYAPSITASATVHEIPMYGRTSDRVICAKFRAGPHPPPHSPVVGGMSGVPEERRPSDAGIAAGWWRRGSKDHTAHDATAPRRDSKGGSEGEDADSDDAVWIVLDMRDEGAFTNILRVLHRHAPASCVSSFAPHLSASTSKPEPGYSFPPPASSRPTSPLRTPSPLSPMQESDVSHTPRARRMADVSLQGLPYPEWRLAVVRRARRAGLGAVGRAMELVMFGEDEAVNDAPAKPTVPAPPADPGGDVQVWPAVQRPARVFGEDVLDDTSDTDTDSTDSSTSTRSSECEWEGWTADLARQRAVHVHAEETRQRQLERGRRTPAEDTVLWAPGWGGSWGGSGAEGAPEYDGSPQLTRRAEELMVPRTLMSYSSVDSPLWRTLRGSPSRERPPMPPVSMPVPLPAYARPRSLVAGDGEGEDVASYLALARREGAMSPPRALYSPRSFERGNGILMPIPVSMAMSTFRTSTVSVGTAGGERGARPRVPSLQWPTSPRSPVRGWGRREHDRDKGKGKEKEKGGDVQGEGSRTLGQNLLRPARLKLSLGLSQPPASAPSAPDHLSPPPSAMTVASLDSMKFVAPPDD